MSWMEVELTCSAKLGLHRMKLTMTDWLRPLRGNPKWCVFSDLLFCACNFFRTNFNTIFTSSGLDFLRPAQLAPQLHNFFTVFYRLLSLSVASLPLLRSDGFTNFLLFLLVVAVNFVFTTFRLTFFGTHILIYSDIFLISLNLYPIL